MKKRINSPSIFGVHWGIHLGFWIALNILLFVDYLPWIYDEKMNIVDERVKDPFTLSILSTAINSVFAYIHLYFFVNYF